MFTKHSGIRGWLVQKTPVRQQLDSDHGPGLIARLGDVKVETKGPMGDGDIDHPTPVERYPD